MNGLTLEATPNNGMYRVATVVHPAGQRNDSEPVLLVGSRYHDKKLYRGYLKREDSSLVDGPLLMGFYSSRSASSALRHYCEDEEIHGVIKLNELDIEHLKGTYDRADGIEYAGHTFPVYNDPIRTPDHPTKSHAVLAREGSKVKLIRFGQQGVKGSPKRKGESEASRKRRESFKARHAKEGESIKGGIHKWLWIRLWWRVCDQAQGMSYHRSFNIM